jgi:hypothetical protein
MGSTRDAFHRLRRDPAGPAYQIQLCLCSMQICPGFTISCFRPDPPENAAAARTINPSAVRRPTPIRERYKGFYLPFAGVDREHPVSDEAAKNENVAQHIIGALLIGCKSYGLQELWARAPMLDEARAALRAEYLCGMGTLSGAGC